MTLLRHWVGGPAFASAGERDPTKAHHIRTLLFAKSSVNYVQQGVEVAVQVRDRRLAASGASYEEAFDRFCRLISDFDVSNAGEDVSVWLEKCVPATAGKSATKQSQKTIGVSSKKSLLGLIGERSRSDRSAAARELFTRGFKTLDTRLGGENSQAVFASFQDAYDALPDSATEQWMLRLDPRAYGRAIVRAREYGKSASNLAALCIAYAPAT